MRSLVLLLPLLHPEGGILDIPIASAYTYPSEYATNGSVTWSSWPASIESSAEGTSSQLGPVTWPIWSDTFLAAPLGWSSLLWQVRSTDVLLILHRLII